MTVRLLIWLATRVPSERLSAWLMGRAIEISRSRERGWQQLPPPSQAEMDEWADGLVHQEARDGTLLHFDPEQRKWLPCPPPTKSMTSGDT